MPQSHVYRGFRIKIVEDGDSFKAHWCESMKDEWAAGTLAPSQSQALSRARVMIDRQYLIESEQLDEAGKPK